MSFLKLFVFKSWLMDETCLFFAMFGLVSSCLFGCSITSQIVGVGGRFVLIKEAIIV